MKKQRLCCVVNTLFKCKGCKEFVCRECYLKQIFPKDVKLQEKLLRMGFLESLVGEINNYRCVNCCSD